MQFVSCHNGQIFTSTTQWGSSGGTFDRRRVFRTGLSAIDELLLDQSFSRGVIHEILHDSHHGDSRFFALLIARSAGGNIIWCDPGRTLYPPAVAAAGVPLEKLFLLHPKNAAEQSWAISECMRCRGVGATVANVAALSRIQARRLQLAAERGGGIGILLRPMDRNASIYAAATRWLVSAVPGERTVQKWKIQLIHAHGGRVNNQTVILEHHRETNIVRAVEQLVDRQGAAKIVAVRVSA
jgi:protein ImuA